MNYLNIDTLNLEQILIKLNKSLKEYQINVDYLINEYKNIYSKQEHETKTEQYQFHLKEIEKILTQYISELEYTIKSFEEVEKG